MEEEKELSFSNLDAREIAWQYRLIWDWHNKLPFNQGVQKILLSGAVGSAKTTIASWLCLYVALNNKKAKILIGRKALPDLRDTLYKDITELLDADDNLIEGVDYTCYDNVCRIVFHKTKSEIMSRTWADKKYKKVRSLKLCLAVIEEATENDEDDKQAHDNILQRLNRIGHIKTNAMVLLTNPDSPGHWIYKSYIEKAKEDTNTHVYYSLTSDNPYIDRNYVRFLEENLSKADADRMLRGLWVEIDSNRIYYNYKSEKCFKRETPYRLNPAWPIDLMCDFNIGEGKPMSFALGQVEHVLVKDEFGARWKKIFHVFREFHGFTMRTEELLEEMQAAGAFDLPCPKWRIFGDATGRSRDTRSLRSDYEIIETFISNYKTSDNERLEFEFCVPRANPPLRRRHNGANGLFENSLGETRFFVYKGCEWVDEGFRLTQPKKGSLTVEDDGPSFPWQHVTTSITYWTDYNLNKISDPSRSSMRRKV